jgi:hypothetical protein
MSHPPTDYLGYTIKTKKREVFKHKGKGIIFDTRADAQSWITFHCAEYDKQSSLGDVLTADERIALEGCEIIYIQGNL